MNIKLLDKLKDIILHTKKSLTYENVEDKMKLGAAAYVLISVLTNITYAIETDGFQFKDLYPALSYEGVGAVVFIIYFARRLLKKRKSEK